MLDQRKHLPGEQCLINMYKVRQMPDRCTHDEILSVLATDAIADVLIGN
jgi:hypothetical protein